MPWGEQCRLSEHHPARPPILQVRTLMARKEKGSKITQRAYPFLPTEKAAVAIKKNAFRIPVLNASCML